MIESSALGQGSNQTELFVFINQYIINDQYALMTQIQTDILLPISGCSMSADSVTDSFTRFSY